MIIFVKEAPKKTYPACCGGKGEVKVNELLEAKHLYPPAKKIGVATITPGSSIGPHIHTGEMEVYCILEGDAFYNDNGKEVLVGPGDACVTYAGQTHGLRPVADNAVVFLSVIISQ